MDKLTALEGEWLFQYEDAALDAETPLWTFKAGQVMLPERPDAGRYWIGDDGLLHIHIPSERSEDGPELVDFTLDHPGDAFREPTTFTVQTEALSGNHSQTIEGMELATHCALLRKPPSLH